MPQPPNSAARPAPAQPGAWIRAWLGTPLAFATLAFAAISACANPAGADENGQARERLAAGATWPIAVDPDEAWRARGVVYVALPFGLRVRYDAQALHRRGPADPRQPLAPFASDLADRRSLFGAVDFIDHASAPDAAGPLGNRLLESRFTLSRALLPRVELEVAWAARSPLAMVDLLRIEDRRVTAMIRFVP